MGGLQKEPFKGKRTGSVIRWKPDTEVFTDIADPGRHTFRIRCDTPGCGQRRRDAFVFEDKIRTVYT